MMVWDVLSDGVVLDSDDPDAYPWCLLEELDPEPVPWAVDTEAGVTVVGCAG